MLCQISLFYPPESQLFLTFCFWLSEEKNGGAVTITQSIMVFVLIKKNKNLSACICKMSVSQNTVPQCSAEVMSFIQSNWSQWNSVCGSKCIMKLFLSFSKKKLFFFPKPKCPNCLKQRQLSGVACQLPLFNGLINLIRYSCSSQLCNTLLYTVVYWGTLVQLEETVSTWMVDVFLDLC